MAAQSLELVNPCENSRMEHAFRAGADGLLACESSRHLATLPLVSPPHYPDLGSVSDWLNQISQEARPIRSTTQIYVVTRHQYGISAFVSQTSFGGKTSGSVAKCRLFSQANGLLISSHLKKFPMEKTD